MEHLDRPIAVDGLAAARRDQPAQLLRRFRAATGTTPLDWILAQRVRLAQRLLEQTSLPLEMVAERAGFGSAVTMRHHFAQRVRTSPQAYRRTFRAGPAQPA